MSKSAEHREELEKAAKEDEYMGLVMQLIQSARNGKNDLYRDAKKEIKRLNLTDPAAKAFFSATLGRIKEIKL